MPTLEAAARLAVEDRLHRALAVFRLVVTLNMLALTAWRWGNFDRPGWTLVAVAAILVWTVTVHLLYRRAEGRTTLVHVVDLLVTVLALAVTPFLKGSDFNASLPGFWVMCAVLAWAVHWNWRGGVFAAAVVSTVDLAIRPHITQTNYGNVFLLLLGGALIGYMCQSLQAMASERAVAERRAAVAGERARLARAVHDGVLQVLALVQRKGAAEADSDWGELAGLAGEQEAALRALIHAQEAWTVASVPGPVGLADGASAPSPPDAPRDLAGALEQGVGPTVTVATPGRAVLLPGRVVEVLLGAVGACLDNVRLHVGLTAPAWVLLEDHGDSVVVSVRDEGPGIAAGRLVEARQQGRLGVQSSICGRLEEVGGSAEVHTGDWGTEWELTVRVPDREAAS
ncbi:MacS family sensor histidine kinase [Nocardioides jishulii]|uniref:Histidine kinase n=1 Tax=Nocardioides jishulii TaxID=2575440 RepID=A0A4U2YKC9_9ACTN|nr:DUF5931 domain-containing protein [Nocardioides jishulii]QCX27153.1 histidine kinase [Nocardioides jishulii]TKI61637.1 histidine kinase [Nocardioides jishulii]